MSKTLELALKIAATVTGDKDLSRMAEVISELGNDADSATPKADALAKKLDELTNQQSDKELARIAAAVRELGDDAGSSTPKTDTLANALDKLAAQQGDKNLSRVADAVRELGNDAGGATPKTDDLASKLNKLASQTGDKELARIANAIDEIGNDANAAAPKTDALAGNLNKLGSQQNDKELTRTANAIDELGNDANAAAPKTDALAGNLNKLGSQQNDKELTRTANAIDELGNDANAAAPKTETLADKLEKLANQQALIRQFEQSTNALKANEMAVYAAAVQLQKLQKEADSSGKPFVDLAKNTDLAEKQLAEMRTELASQSASHQRLQRELQKSGVDTADLANEKKRVQGEFKRTSEDAKKLGDDYDNSNQKQNSFSQGAANLTSRLVALAGTYLGLNKLWDTVKSIFETGSQFEKLGVQFNALMGSIEGGEQATEWVKQFAIDTPLSIEEVSKAFVRLKAFGLDPMDGTLQAVTDQAFKLGGGFQEVEGISLALGQAWAKQKLQGEEILQLIERGVPVWDLLQQVTGKNTAELQKLSEQGKLGRDVIKQLMEEIGNQSSGAAAANMTLLSGLISNAKDNLQQFYNMVSQSGSMDWLKEQIAGLNAEFAEMAADGRLQEWAQRFSDTIVSAGTLIRDTGKALWEFREEIGFVAKAWLALKVGSFLGDVIDGAKKAATGLKTYVDNIRTTEGATDKLTVATKALGAAIGLMAVNWAIEQFIKLKDAYFDLQAATIELEKSQNNLATSQRMLDAEFASLSKSVGMQITSMEQLLDAEKAGLVVYDEKLRIYRSAKEVAEELAAAEREQTEQLKLTTDQAAAAAAGILEMSEAFAQNADTADSLNRQINAVLEVLKQAGPLYADQVKQLEQLAEKNRQLGAVYDEKQKLLKDTEEAYKALGITSAKTLEETAAKAQAAYEIIAAGDAPLEIQRQAFLKWAEAAVNAAKATGDAIPQTTALKAEALGLTNQFNDLVSKAGAVSEFTDATGKSFSVLTAEIEKTSRQIELYESVLSSSTATLEEKRLATIRLADAEKLLQNQQQSLIELERVRKGTYFELKLALEEGERQLASLNERYINGSISTADYNEKLQHQTQIVNALKSLMPTLSGAQNQHAAAQENAKQKIEQTTSAAKEQQSAFKSLGAEAQRSAQYISLIAQAQQAASANIDVSSKSTAELNARTAELGRNIGQNARVTRAWWSDLADASNMAFRHEQDIIKTELAMRNYTAQLASGSLTMQQLNNISRSLDYNMSKLGDQQLSTLRMSITDAQNRLMSFRDELSGTLTSLQDELDQLNDNQAAIEQRRYQSRVEELEAKLREAQATGDNVAIATAQQALAVAKEIYMIKNKQAQEEDAAARKLKDAANAANNANTSATSTTSTGRAAPATTVYTPTATPTPTPSGNSRTVRLELVMPGGSYSATMDGFDADRMLAQLERARSTSL